MSTPVTPQPPARSRTALYVVAAVAGVVVLALVAGLVAMLTGGGGAAQPVVAAGASTATSSTTVSSSTPAPSAWTPAPQTTTRLAVVLDEPGRQACETFAAAVQRSGPDIGTGEERRELAGEVNDFAVRSTVEGLSGRAFLLLHTAGGTRQEWLVASGMFREACGG